MTLTANQLFISDFEEKKVFYILDPVVHIRYRAFQFLDPRSKVHSQRPSVQDILDFLLLHSRSQISDPG